eukprot:CAMPEP_0119146082 /NCGR_PEP_ID=MMETSP1310-20130426/38394_1 /TAXON_ID=464262 /ORGANISM="Genus nov. species nov., Strain RCC2339" /LENGTH=914 /DNA_ID=CAMNT_0007137951 /DNA_START=29 /DNA_END=2773 /DNA_ORIENTATION=+
MTVIKVNSQLFKAYEIDIDRVFEVFRTSPGGLVDPEVAERKVHFGKNEIRREKPVQSFLDRFWEGIKEPLIGLLLASAGVSLLIGEYGDAVSIVLAVLIVTLVGIWQQYNSEKSIEALMRLSTHKCTVVRNGVSMRVLSSDLVPGDVVQLDTGDKIPADVRLFEANDFCVDESILTGESKPVKKSSLVLPFHTHGHSVCEMTNIAFLGTACVRGNGRGVVISTGRNTELGKISYTIQSIEAARSPLQEKMDEIGRMLTYFAFAVIAIICVLGMWQGKPLITMFSVGVSLAVAAIPEGLPIVVTVTLALGAARMASRNAIVRKLPVVEGLGAATVLCTDKTGTLTANEMTVESVWVPAHGPVAVASPPAPAVASDMAEAVASVADAAVLCCNVACEERGEPVGMPTECALWRLLRQLGRKDPRPSYHRLSEVPFTSDRKWMAVTVEFANRAHRTIIKGAPERVVDLCTRIRRRSGGARADEALTPEMRALIQEQVDRYGEKAYRVLAVASGEGSQAGGLTLIGLLAIRDRLKMGVREAVQNARRIGVQVVVVTGDSRATSLAIAREIGIVEEHSVILSGSDLNRLSDEELQRVASQVAVFYRVDPNHKLRIVDAFVRNGETVAMTGDGVNDAPALKKAHIGIAMGKRGTDVAKEAAEIVLADDHLATIYTAILEGKAIYRNILSFLRYQLTTSLSCLLIVLLSPLLSLPIPMNPTQILWINIIMDGPPAQSLGMEPADLSVAHLPPRRRSEPVFSGHMLLDIAWGTLVMTCGTVFLFVQELYENDQSAKFPSVRKRAMTMAFTTFVFFQLFNAFNCRTQPGQSVFHRRLLRNSFFWVAITLSFFMQVAAIYVPLLQYVFQTTSLTPTEFLLSITMASTVLVVDELRKLLHDVRTTPNVRSPPFHSQGSGSVELIL